jgi:hypothetical protein
MIPACPSGHSQQEVKAEAACCMGRPPIEHCKIETKNTHSFNEEEEDDV